jgi:hypothetical protein
MGALSRQNSSGNLGNLELHKISVEIGGLGTSRLTKYRGIIDVQTTQYAQRQENNRSDASCSRESSQFGTLARIQRNMNSCLLRSEMQTKNLSVYITMCVLLTELFIAADTADH